MESKLVQSKFYKFSQNNSGGGFDQDAESGIGYEVVIEAFSADEANSKAEGIGIYFDGCDDGRDCSCCGDRWYPVSEDDGEAEVRLSEFRKHFKGKSYVHYLNGKIEEFE